MSSAKTAMETWNYAKPWYHGSPFELTVLRVGSSITQYVDVARAFSHKPSLLSLSVSGGADGQTVTVKHTGVRPGFLYRVVDDVGPSDVHPHQACNPETLEEWLIEREMRLELVCATTPLPEEHLSEEEVSVLMERMQRNE